jgi:uncharacterized membrane protein SpoIIM required for sporulation
MNVSAFERDRSARWDALGNLLSRADGRSYRLDADEIRRLGELYRSATADLALAHRSFPGDPVTARLERLVKEARACVYSLQPSGWRLWEFARRGYWRRVAERPGILAVAAALLLAPLALGAAWGASDPDAAIGVVPGQFRGAVEPDAGRPELSADEKAAFSADIFTNNIQVTVLAFAGGITAGLATAGLLIFNGLFIGVIAGIAGGSGREGELLTLITAHGVLELSCITVGAAAGLRMGWAIIEPGTVSRSRALRSEARKALEMLGGTAPWLVVAGLVEAFVSGSAGTAAAIGIGVTLGALYWSLVLVLGSPTQSRARSFAVT